MHALSLREWMVKLLVENGHYMALGVKCYALTAGLDSRVVSLQKETGQ
ncbi:MAG: hypothetical protein AAF388_15750 [Bacteroidota bacterium]